MHSEQQTLLSVQRRVKAAADFMQPKTPKTVAQEDNLMLFLEQTAAGCISGQVVEWPQLKPACAWAETEIKKLRKIIGGIMAIVVTGPQTIEQESTPDFDEIRWDPALTELGKVSYAYRMGENNMAEHIFKLLKQKLDSKTDAL